MKTLLVRTVFSFLFFVFFSLSVRAQNQGQPAFQTLTYDVLAGGGMGIGAAVIWSIATPSESRKKFGEYLVTGFALGCIAGLIFGAYDLSSHSFIPEPSYTFSTPINTGFKQTENQLQLQFLFAKMRF